MDGPRSVSPKGWGVHYEILTDQHASTSYSSNLMQSCGNKTWCKLTNCGGQEIHTSRLDINFCTHLAKPIAWPFYIGDMPKH